ncbi:MAG: inositol monophosphatase [Candidatus Pacebacteria bacterium]|nr:inositol monophosphatase [Candidatus Paceibacterota bacterium]
MSPKYLNFISQTLDAVSRIAHDNWGKVAETVKQGDNNQVLTETDLAVGKEIIQRIQKVFPDYNIIDEEAGVIDRESRFTWVVDPIDGTSNFVAGLPTYGIMVGLLDGDIPIAGGIALPAFSQLFIAEKSFGTTCNGVKIRVTEKTDPLSILVAYGIDGHQEDPQRTVKEVEILGKIILGIRNLRTTNSAYDMAHVADGKYGAFLNQTTKIWDNVAVQPIIEEAGGVVTDFWGKPMNYSRPLERAQENFTICMGAPGIHAKLQDIIRAKQ